MSKAVKRSLTGIRASGNVHIGNYLGAIKPALERQSSYQCIYFIADLHALTTTKDPILLKQSSYDLVATWLALGLDVKKHVLFRQSDVPMVTEFAWYLSTCVGMGLLEKSHAYKDALAHSKEVSHAVFTYPVLMAADILMYDVDVVPVGKDQKQHVEMARDMAGSFNAIYGEGTIKLPEPAIDDRVMLIPGLDGRKMSKSYNNEIPLFADEATLKKLIMSLKTDSTPLEDPKTLDGSTIGELYSLFTAPDGYADLKSRLAKGGMGWGHAKAELFERINDALSEYRKHYVELRADERSLDNVLKIGADKAISIALPVLNRVRNSVGLSSHL